MKGVIICGGSGTRLRPLTEITNKSLLPVYDRPLIHYPLETLLRANIKDIIIITGSEHIEQMASYLGSGARFGCTFSYKVQEKAEGIAQALGIAEDFANGSDICAILGDNVYFDDLSPIIANFKNGAHVFLKEVPDVNRFGVAELKDGKVIDIQEKPKIAKSPYAVTGCYVYDSRCFEVIRNLKPSARNEFEITDVSNWYAHKGEMTASVLQHDWVDAGTFESLHKASSLARDIRMKAIQAGQTSAQKTTEKSTVLA